jgi:hypothetical protein
MTLQVFAVHDNKAEAYMKPFFAQTKGLALRGFVEACNNPEHDMSRYAADYHIFRIAEYDDATGIITPLETKENLGCALDFIDKKPEHTISKLANIQKAVENYSTKEGVLNGDSRQ